MRNSNRFLTAFRKFFKLGVKRGRRFEALLIAWSSPSKNDRDCYTNRHYEGGLAFF